MVQQPTEQKTWIFEHPLTRKTASCIQSGSSSTSFFPWKNWMHLFFQSGGSECFEFKLRKYTLKTFRIVVRARGISGTPGRMNIFDRNGERHFEKRLLKNVVFNTHGEAIKKSFSSDNIDSSVTKSLVKRAWNQRGRAIRWGFWISFGWIDYIF